MDVQKGSMASATERTAYSCSSKSFDERASDAANAKSRSSSPVLLMVPAKTRDVTMLFVKRKRSSGVAPTNPATEKFQVEGYSAAKVFKIERASIAFSEVPTTSRANTTLSRPLL